MSGILWAVLAKKIPAECRLSGDVKEYVHHVTLKMGKLKEEHSSLVGKTFPATAIADCWSEELGVQAIKVELPEELKAVLKSGQQSHITLFCKDGVKPFTSNKLLKGEHKKVVMDMPLELMVKFCPDEDIQTEQAKSMKL